MNLEHRIVPGSKERLKQTKAKQQKTKLTIHRGMSTERVSSGQS